MLGYVKPLNWLLQYMSLSNRAQYHVTKWWAPRGYRCNVCSSLLSAYIVHSVRCDYYQEVILGPQVGVVPDLLWCCMSLSISLFPQLQLWHLHCLWAPAVASSIGIHFLSHKGHAAMWKHFSAGWCLPEWHSSNCHTSVPPWLLQVLSVQTAWQYAVIRSLQLSTAVCLPHGAPLFLDSTQNLSVETILRDVFISVLTESPGGRLDVPVVLAAMCQAGCCVWALNIAPKWLFWTCIAWLSSVPVKYLNSMS
jgi:hypothetical protein